MKGAALLACAAALAIGCKTAETSRAKDAQEAKEVLGDFIAAASARDFARAYLLLAGTLRARYTPQRLAEDFDAEPLAKERLERARQALRLPPALHGDVAEFAIGPEKAVRLVRENGTFRVAALE